MTQLAVIVLAAGSGSRMQSQTHKLLHNLAGVPVLGHVLSTVDALEPEFGVVVVRHQSEQILNYLESREANYLTAQQDQIPGTARAVELGLSQLPPDWNGQVVVMSGDAPLIDLHHVSRLVQLHRESKADATLLTAVVENPTGYGRILRSGAALQGIVEQSDCAPEELEIAEVNAGCYVFEAAALRKWLPEVSSENAQSERYLTDVPRMILISGGSVSTLLASDPWIISGINDRVQLSSVAVELNRRLNHAWQLAGVTIENPDLVWVDVTVMLGKDVTLLSGTRLHGHTTIGANSSIGPDSTLQDCEVGERVVIKRSELTATTIKSGSVVGPFSHLRSGTHLGEDSKVGAFVEMKNAELGSGAKVPHLSYVGDATIGRDANIGAGTIFANYDGVDKHHTSVGDGASIGSGTVLVAPVSIGSGAYSGARSLIRKDVSPGALVFNPGEQVEIADWVLKKRPGSSAAESASRAKES